LGFPSIIPIERAVDRLPQRSPGDRSADGNASKQKIEAWVRVDKSPGYSNRLQNVLEVGIPGNSEREMIWTTGNLIIQIIAGIIGAHFAATAAKEHSFGFIGHTLVGAIGGGLSGYFLQGLADTVVTANGSLNDITGPDNFVMQGLAGMVAGGCLMLVVGFIKHAREQHHAQKE